jgi:hypothetical protein
MGRTPIRRTLRRLLYAALAPPKDPPLRELGRAVKRSARRYLMTLRRRIASTREARQPRAAKRAACARRGRAHRLLHCSARALSSSASPMNLCADSAASDRLHFVRCPEFAVTPTPPLLPAAGAQECAPSKQLGAATCSIPKPNQEEKHVAVAAPLA